MNQKKSASILKKFLLFNLLVFSILGLITFIYLQAIQPSLVKNKSSGHLVVIKNTTDHLQRLKINFNKENLNRAFDISKISPAFYGNFMTLYATKK